MVYHVEMLPFLFATALSLMIAAYSARRRDIPAARTLTWLVLASALWTGVYVIHLGVPTLEAKLFTQKIIYFGSVSTAPLWLMFTLQITGRKHWLTRPFKFLMVFWAITVVTLVLTNEWHHLYWTEYYLSDEKLEGASKHGPLFQVYQFPVLLLLFFNLVLFAHYYLTCPRFYRPQAIFLFLGGSFPLLARIIDLIFNITLLDRVDQVPLWLAVSNIFLAIAIFRYNTLDVLSVAQRLVIDNIKAGVVVIDHEARVLGMNPYATERWPHPEPIGEPLVYVIPGCIG
ncbi:MAG: histidine kinase N-terminal 7TM domain-containing protein, partial [Pseudomonadota bacterium]